MDLLITCFPLIVAAVVLFLSVYLRSAHGHREKERIHRPLNDLYSDEFEPEDISLKNEVEIARARSLWIVAAVVFIFISICTILLSGYILLHYSWLSRIPWPITLSFAALFCAFVYKHTWTGGGGKGLLVALDRCEKRNITSFIKKLNLLAGLAGMLMVLACCILMRMDKHHDAMYMCDILFLTKISLYLSTSFFLSGQLEIYALFKWAGRWLEATADKPEVDFSGLADSLTIERGLLFSVLLLGVFLPVSLRHQLWINNSELHVELLRLGIEKPPIAEIGNYVVCMTPLLLGVTSNITSWASKLGKWTQD